VPGPTRGRLTSKSASISLPINSRVTALKRLAAKKRHICRRKPCNLLATSVVLKVEEAACIDAHHGLTAGNDINAKRTQLQVNHVRAEAESYPVS